MARRKRSPSSAERDAFDIANGPLFDREIITARPLPRLPFMPVVRSPVITDEDHRLFNPEPIRIAKSTRRWSPRLILAKPVRGSRRLSPAAAMFRGLQFAHPRYVIACIRRHTRKEVLHALRLTGKGSGGGKKRRNYNSSLRC